MLLRTGQVAQRLGWRHVVDIMDSNATGSETRGENADQATLGALCRYFLRLGTLGFGGPVALVGYMQRDLVEERRWVTEREFRDGLAVAQLAPGPLAAQLAMWLAFIRTGVLGATLASFAFIGPSFVISLPSRLPSAAPRGGTGRAAVRDRSRAWY